MSDSPEAVEVVNALNWFEIPTTDIDRAIKFYNTILDAKIKRDDPDGQMMAFLPSSGGVGGALIQHEEYTPGHAGTVVYLNGGENLSVILARVEGAGGKVIGDKMDIGENGFVAYFEDTEGNRVGLHSMN